jgi:hypothetical protein
MATTTNYGWTTPDDTALVKDGAAAIRTLGSSVDTTTKALNPSTTLGDIEYRSSTANTNTRLGIGSTGNILTVAGGVPTWAAPAASGGMTLISETVASASTGIDFTSISGSYKQLLLVWAGVAHDNAGSGFGLRINADSGANYYCSGMTNQGTTVFSTEATNTSIFLRNADYLPFGLNANFADASTGYLTIDNYASTTKFKTFYGMWSYYNGGATTTTPLIDGYYKSTSAITELNIVRLSGTQTITNNANTTIRLYGVN